MIRNVSWVVALPAEAKPLIKRFRLSRVKKDQELFPVYRSEDESISLVISGLGKALSAAAVAHLAQFVEGGKGGASVWINFGIAGSGLHDYGETFLASKVVDEGSGRAWYPPAICSRKIDLARREIVTVDQPVSRQIEGSSLVEMEAAGFLSVAAKLTTLEFCQCVKVVSDDPDHSIREINKDRVEELCSEALVRAEDWLKEIVAINDERESRNGNPRSFDEWMNAARFTVSESHQLRKLLQQFECLGEKISVERMLQGVKDRRGKDCLESLRKELKDVRSKIR